MAKVQLGVRVNLKRAADELYKQLLAVQLDVNYKQKTDYSEKNIIDITSVVDACRHAVAHISDKATSNG